MYAMQKIRGFSHTWHFNDAFMNEALTIAVKYSLSVPLSYTLLSRGYQSASDIENYLFSSFDKDVAHPLLLKDAQRAVDRLLYAIAHQEKILIFGDYDVDGITSTSLMMAALQPLGAQVNFYLPHRVKDGYGLSTKIIERAAENGYKVIITVDNGTTAFEQAILAKKLGIDLIITDHHKPHGKLPEAFALVNPHQKECVYPFKEFAGVGVSFKLISLLYEQKGLPLPTKAYELLLLGTVADVVPLKGENRFWVRYALALLNKTSSVALDTLKKNGKVTRELLSSLDVGFKIAPQINALGRLEDPRQGVQFLLGSYAPETERIGAVLLELNEARKKIERAIFEDVQTLIENGTVDLKKERIILVASKEWQPGVIGLVASRLMGLYCRPVILLHITKEGKAKGSCRSISAFNIFSALEQCADLLDQFGGHACAAGLSLSLDKVPLLKERLEALALELLTDEHMVPTLKLDAQITLPDVTKKIVDDMHHFEPFGAENREPQFLLKQVSIVQKPQLLKEAHIKCSVFADGIIKPLIIFNSPLLYEPLLAQEEEPFDVAVQITANHWQGRTNIELLGLDVAGLRKKI